MQNLDAKDTIQKIKETKPEIEKELKKSTENVKRNENADIHQKLIIVQQTKKMR